MASHAVALGVLCVRCENQHRQGLILMRRMDGGLSRHKSRKKEVFKMARGTSKWSMEVAGRPILHGR